MRELVLDTETTGFDPETGDRIVEIGIAELVNHLPTGEIFHVYINPERSMPQSAFEVHGISDEFLTDKPKFKEIVDAFLNFIKTDPLIIHNASFDMKFLNAELVLVGKEKIPDARAVDTLEMARRKFPGMRNSLDALCQRFRIDTSRRELHGALLDARLLAEVYLGLLGGREPGLDFGLSSETKTAVGVANVTSQPPRPSALPRRLDPDEQAQHRAFLQNLGITPWE